MKRPHDQAPTDDLAPESEDPRLLAAAQEYLAALEAGERPERQAFLDRYADIAEELDRYLDVLDMVQSAAPRSEQPEPAGGTPDEDPFVGMPLGDYQIVREVGRGGMGVVYEAVQLSLGRRVALKVLPFAATLDAGRLRRFKNEVHAAACLHHTNIVPIFAVGCQRGVHFYAMQFIEGRNLADLILEMRRQAGVPDEEEKEEAAPPSASTQAASALLTQRSAAPAQFFRTAARLIVQAAEALHHAHQQGVVHRDMKPANVMVDGGGNLWVTDFGLAQVQSDPRLTTTGALVGTLRYMSPEQASGEMGVDHRTDVYSLGATLYELLALRPAFDAADRAPLIRQIVQEEPPPLRGLAPGVPADLETIVAKAMAKGAGDRYATAQALADDLRRFLEDKPIQAKRPSLLEKAAKWARRRRGLVAATMALLLLAVCGLTVAIILIALQQAETRRAYDLLAKEHRLLVAEQVKTQSAYEAEARERQRAEEAGTKARQLLDFFTRVSEEDLPDLPVLREVRRKLLEAALSYYKDFIVEEGDDPAVQAELAASKWRAATILEDMGKKAEALALFEQVRAALRPPGGGPPPFPPDGRREPGDRPPPPPPGGRPPPALGIVVLLTQAPVQQDLKLSEDQAKAINALEEKRRSKGPHSRGPDGDQEANEAACAEILRPEQVRRLRQIVWQQRGAHAFADADVADALGLTADQRERLRTIEDKAWAGMWGPPPGGPGGRPPPDDFWQGAGEWMLSVLTEQQKAKWKEMTGEPFRGEVRFGSPPPGRGGPGFPPPDHGFPPPPPRGERPPSGT